MFNVSSCLKVYLCVGVTDMRKCIDGLSLLVTSYLSQDVFSGHLFAFCNRSRTIIKILYWDRNGFCLWQKRLEKDKFRWPRESSEVKEVSHRELMWLLDGLDVVQPKSYCHLNYSQLC